MPLGLSYGNESCSPLCRAAEIESAQFALLAGLRALRGEFLELAARRRPGGEGAAGGGDEASSSSSSCSSSESSSASFAERSAARVELRSAKLERLRRDAKESELKTLQATPRINARSRQLAKRTRCADGAEYDIADIADRQAKQRQEELIRREQARKTLEEKQLEGVKETPTINSRSRRLAASRQRRMNNGAESLADRQTRQRRQELARHERARRLKHEMELEEAKQAKPHVSRGSARILRKMKREGRSVAAASVSGTDRLYKQAEAREQRRKAARESARELFSHQPKVNKQSSTGKGKGGARRSGRHSSSGAGGSGSGSVEETNLERDEAMFTLRAMAAQGDARAQALLAK